MNGEEVHNLTLLGKIVKANDSSTSLVYTIDDGTGRGLHSSTFQLNLSSF